MLHQIGLIICTVLLLASLAHLGFKRRAATRSSIRRQQCQAREQSRETAATAAAMDEDRIFADPRIRKAIAEGRVFDAARRVSKASGLPPRTAREIVERRAAH